MRRVTHRLILAALAVALWAPAAAAGQAGVPEPTGPDFRALLLADTGVTPGIRRALEARSALVAPAAFGDLTGDGTSDAVVAVSVPGAAGTVAVYVLSALDRPKGPLRVVYRSQQLYRGQVRVVQGALVVLTAAYARGDDVCCPAAQLQRTYLSTRSAGSFRRTGSVRLPRPG